MACTRQPSAAYWLTSPRPMPRLGFEEAWARRVEFKDGEARYGPREWSPNIIRRLEDATDLSILAPGFPAAMIDDKPRRDGQEVDSEIFSRRLDALEGYLGRLRNLGEAPEPDYLSRRAR